MFKKYLKSIIWALLILILSLLNLSTEKNINPYNLPLDKFVHLSFYFILTILLCIETVKISSGLNIKKSTILKILLFANSYGIFIEFLQFYFTSYRGADIYDALSNFLGSLLSVIILFKFKLLKV